jgi:glycosyltransferase involved in cell wall biosynthesis
MKVSLSYSGGVSRGRQLAIKLDQNNALGEFYSPRFSRFPDLIPPSWWAKTNGIDLCKVKVDPYSDLFRSFMQRTRRLRGDNFYERHHFTQFIDWRVAQRINGGANIFVAESQIALHSFRKARSLGMSVILDRTNSHICHQSKIVDQEFRRHGLDFRINSLPVIQKALAEYDEADYIFVLSNYVKDTFLEHGVPESKIRVVTSGIDLTHFHPSVKEDDIFRLIYCGALCMKKGVHILLKAYSELKLPNSELWLIGPQSKDIHPYLEHYKECFRLIGVVPNYKLRLFYSQGSVFIMPSLEEGLAKVVIEAMACGLPVIATHNTGAADVVREGIDGYILPSRNVKRLQEAILWMYNHPHERLEMGINASARAKESFSLDVYFSRWFSCVKSIFPNY